MAEKPDLPEVSTGRGRRWIFPLPSELASAVGAVMGGLEKVGGGHEQVPHPFTMPARSPVTSTVQNIPCPQFGRW